MSFGYLYCFSNEANISDTWRPPTPYKLEKLSIIF